MLVGRQVEQGRIDALLARSAAGAGGMLILRGEAGIGKSALLGYAAAGADGATLLRARGIEAETDLAFAALHQLLLPTVRLTDRLPAHHANALLSAFGIGPPMARADRFLVFMATLSLLATAADEAPVVCLIDDADWLDGESEQALGFVARRLQHERVAIIVASRDRDPRSFDVVGAEELRLGGLAPDEATALLARAQVGITDQVSFSTSSAQRTAIRLDSSSCRRR